MNKRVMCLLICILLLCGCDNITINDKYEESTSEILNETTSFLNHKDINYILETKNDDKVQLSGKKMLDLEEAYKEVQVTSDKIITLKVTRDNPNGTKMLVINGDYAYNLIYYSFFVRNEENVTDEYGFPLEDYYYELACYDLDQDNIKEIIVAIGNKTDYLAIYILEMDYFADSYENGEPKLVSSVYGTTDAYIDESNKICVMNNQSIEKYEYRQGVFDTKQNIDNKLIASVISCDEKFFDTEIQEFIYLKEYASNNYMYSNNEGKYEYGSYEIDWHDNQKINRWCELDMDSDGNNEVLLELDSSNILVLHNEDDIVYGYAFPYRGMKCIKTDGSFECTGSVANTYIRKLKFIDGDCYYDELCAWDEVDSENLIFRINKKDNDRKSVKKYLAEQEVKEDAVWIEGNPIEGE